MNLLATSCVWGINMGGSMLESSWIKFASSLAFTTIGFVWINERGKDIGASADTRVATGNQKVQK